MKKIRQHNDIDISVILKNTEGEILDPSLCKGIQIRVQTNGNDTHIAKYDIYEDGHIVFRFNAKDQTQIGVYDIVISATTTDGRVFTTDVCKAFCIVPCTCCTDNEPGEVETETLEVEATIEITSWGYMYDKRVEAIEEKLERLDNRDDKLQEQIDNNHSELAEAFEGLYDDVEKNYSKKSNTIRHITLSPIASGNGLSLLLEGEYDDSVQGSHLFGPHNIILPYATESKAGVMSPEDKSKIDNVNIDIEDIKTDINTNKNNIILLDKNIKGLSLSTQKIIDGRTIVAKAKEATSAEKDSEGNVLKTTYAKQEDYNYTLGTALATSELGKYLAINHNYNKTLAIPYATESKAGVMSPEDKKAIVENKNNIAGLSTEVENLVDGYDEEMQAINDKFDELEQAIKSVSVNVSALFADGGTMDGTLATLALNYLHANGATVRCMPIADGKSQNKVVLERHIITYYGSGLTARRDCAIVTARNGKLTTSEVRIKNYELP